MSTERETAAEAEALWNLRTEVECYARERAWAFVQRDAAKAALLAKAVDQSERDAIEDRFHGTMTDREATSWPGFQVRRESIIKLLAMAATAARGDHSKTGEEIARDVLRTLDPARLEFPDR
jgi:hypothetical protein